MPKTKQDLDLEVKATFQDVKGPFKYSYKHQDKFTEIMNSSQIKRMASKLSSNSVIDIHVAEEINEEL